MLEPARVPPEPAWIMPSVEPLLTKSLPAETARFPGPPEGIGQGYAVAGCC